ncbi:MAG: hypothetical protein ABII12_13450 [Planctomycetota bacterium]
MPIFSLPHSATCLCCALLTCIPAAAYAQRPAIFITRPGEVLKLDDANEDGDFLDFAEVSIYADALPPNLGPIDGDSSRLFVIDAHNANIFVLEDLNEDGDALDAGEILLYAEFPAGSVASTPAGLACHPNGTLLSADAAAGALCRFQDLNQDGDALDAGEAIQIADGLTSPLAVAVRPDAKLLLAQDETQIPVRILHDLNADGDYFDFAENISYAENIDPGYDMTALGDDIAYLTRPAEGTVMRLQDLNADDDVLDFGEAVVYTQGLDTPAVVTYVGTDVLYVASNDVPGSVYLLEDLNADGDALDFGETRLVADGITNPAGIAFVGGEMPCLAGDVDYSGAVDMDDVPSFVQVLIGNLVWPDTCPADVNEDGFANGDDIQPFIELLF